MPVFASPGPGSIVCLAGLVAGLAALGAGRLAELRIELDVFNHFIPQLAIIIVACLLGLLLARHSLLTAAVITLIGLIAIGLWPHYVSRDAAAPAVTAGERVVRVMSFNTRFESGAWRAVADEVMRHDPDIVVLLEIGRSKRAVLEELEATWPHRADCLNEDYCQNVILSKTPFVATETRSNWEGPQMVRVEFGPEFGGLAVVGVHTTRPPFSARQLEQMTVLGDELAAAGGPQIVAGDFNAAPTSLMMKTLLERSGFQLASGLATWPATLGLPQIAIDHVMASPGLRILAPARIGAAAGSDHYPVIAHIAVPLP